ncbi:AAA domain-containing protein [Novosphingobium aquiterrae]|uniref:AAA domain-containing protein n=1 Tax=Novosphingobium aquiterrae TaxID=624388 RepID=A0ABV6PLR2_9SPHN
MGIVGETIREISLKVSQYFLDFLESDFKRQQAPRRRVVLQTESGFRSALRVATYPALQHNLWQIIGKRSDGDPTLRVAPRTYPRPISNTLRLIIKEQIQVVADDELLKVRAAVFSQAEDSRSLAIENPEEWVDLVRTTLAAEIGTHIVAPLLALLDGPLSQQSYSVHDSIYAAESELIEIVASRLDVILPEVLSRYLASGEQAEFLAVLESDLALEDVQAEMLAYFESFMAADAFLEFRDLDTYAMTGEGLQLYLYIGQLKFGGHGYPLFYVPIEVERSEGGYTLKLLNHVYANKRAIDYVLQELGERQQRQWLSPITDRITYLAPDQSITSAVQSLFQKIANALDLGGQVELKPGPVLEASNTSVLLSTALHIAVFDRSDEALLNDYEEMISQARQNQPGVMDLFQGIVGSVLVENPKSITGEIDAQWDGRSLVDRVVIDAPVPLNEEQIKILTAIQHPEGRIVVVEGPPGTGKSHTITAIAADCALKGKSCLILSDKTEALNVVQRKLSDTMSQVRHSRDFVNPILRLGQEQANFKKLTSQQTLTQISAYVRASKANAPKIRGELADTRELMRDRIDRTISSLGTLSLREVAEFHVTEKDIEAIDPILAERLRSVKSEATAAGLNETVADEVALKGYLVDLFDRLLPNQGISANSLEQQLRLDVAVLELSDEVEGASLALLETCSSEHLARLTRWVLEYDQLRMPVFGYLFRGGAIRTIERDLNESLLPIRPVLMKQEIAILRDIQRDATKLRLGLPAHFLTEDDLGNVFSKIAQDRIPPTSSRAAKRMVFGLCKVLSGALPDALTQGTAEQLAERWLLVVSYLTGLVTISAEFAKVPEFDYAGSKSVLERLNVSVMNTEVDNRLVQFMDNSRADARILSSIVANRQKFPEEKFEDVKNAFPVIIANIRQFGEYMPLAPGVFDVVVIDEASQVSVAQAFPAMLRAKKLVVLGDSKQFSNTKSSNASIALNEKYKADLNAYFRQKVAQDAGTLQRLSRFDVKCSILEFCQLCANYSIMLRKHFRSYQELISYSSQTFYGGQLQAIKIRGVPLDEVIRFDQIEVGEAKATRGTNEAEARFILTQLLELLEDDEPPTVGIITPFREQQALLTKLLFSHASGAEFQDKLRLKVMTFDSCQGEERKIVFYSMVATAENDALNYVFPVDLTDAEERVEEKLKVQRLNVGFSRAEELVWFVLSKPIADYRGSIGQVLNHYNNILQRGDISPDLTDPNSPMETKVLDWLQKTQFYQQHGDSVEILPQFPIGDYLRQLDPTYKHPSWRVDFLVTFVSDQGIARIVIEYDGFEHHFQKGKDVNVGSHERYLLEADIERQLTLESYGYRFLRINRFNLGNDPVQTLSDRLNRLVEALFDENGVDAVEEMQALAGGLASKELKQCTRCNSIKPLVEFFDQSLKDGAGATGRVCMSCKNADSVKKRVRPYSGSRGRRGYRRRWR